MDNASIGCSSIKTEYHKCPLTKRNVASIRGIDVSEACDGYSASELRAISRYLDNIADHVDYHNSIENTSSLFSGKTE
jgi:hypothetical protein